MDYLLDFFLPPLAWHSLPANEDLAFGQKSGNRMLKIDIVHKNAARKCCVMAVFNVLKEPLICGNFEDETRKSFPPAKSKIISHSVSKKKGLQRNMFETVSNGQKAGEKGSWDYCIKPALTHLSGVCRFLVS